VGRVVIGMDPHKRSATIEVLDKDEQPLMAGRFGTDRDGYRLMLAASRQFRSGYGRSRAARVWAASRATPGRRRRDRGRRAGEAVRATRQPLQDVHEPDKVAGAHCVVSATRGFGSAGGRLAGELGGAGAEVAEEDVE
jgi:hypothetical protein